MRLFREALSAQQSQIQLTVANTGEEALRILRDNPNRPDLIVLDLSLPGMTGREVLKIIKSDARLRCIPVVVFSVSNAQDDINNAYDLHANCYIRKPVDFQEYMDAMARCEAFWLSVARLPSSC